MDLNFNYEGPLGSSKSILNRALLLRSFFGQLKIVGSSLCQDVLDLDAALSALGSTTNFSISEGGTSFRFLALRLSREVGTFRIRTSKRLLARPQDEIIDLLSQLGVRAKKYLDEFIIEGSGWQFPQYALRVRQDRSSQFLSALFLNSPHLDWPLHICDEGQTISRAYFDMTLRMSKDLGLDCNYVNGQWILAPWNQLKRSTYEVGADLSSAFAVACFAAVGGHLKVTNVVDPELQPDYRFFDFFRRMSVPCSLNANSLEVKKSTNLRGLSVELSDCPDLFPMLSVLCAVAKGDSKLYGAPQLKHKESDRQKKIFELFEKAKIEFTPLVDGIEIKGSHAPSPVPFDFDPDHDHRMAMAAAFLKFCGWKIRLTDPNVVKKSFPDFWKIVRVTP